jgi:hypothetical protein
MDWYLGRQNNSMSENLELNLDAEAVSLEELTSDGEGSGLEAERLDDPSTGPYDPAKIDVITQARTIDLLLTRLREGELDLSPDFQRRSNLWNPKRKSSLIESILLRIPIPSLYVSEDLDGNYSVVDGLQRICAIAHFIDAPALDKALKINLQPLRLTGLESLEEYNDEVFLDLPRPLQRRINETELTLHVIRASTPSNVKFNIFSRINQGGLPLTAQEIRNAIYPGPWRARIRGLAESQQFLEATERKIKIERMGDIELALRFVAHYTLDPHEKRPEDQNLDKFLNETIEFRSVSWDEEHWDEIETAFFRAMKYAPKIFGRIAFRKYSGMHESRRPINRGLFEAESVAVAQRTVEELEHLAAKSEVVIENFREVFESDQDFQNALLYATGRGGNTTKRIETIDNLLNEALLA